MITFEDVSKIYDVGTTAVDRLDLEVSDGEIVVLVGPSGCGKTTTLRLINRMIEPSSGRIEVDGRDVQSVSPHELRRGIGYVIQSGGLFPHRTIADNIATVPRLLGWDRRQIEDRVGELLELVGLPQHVATRYPHQLSGGQRQRVGVGRALAVDPPVMLMDEPFGAVDPIVRTHLQDEFLRLQAEMRKTIVFVTHDIDEAIRVGDRIAIFNVGGVVEQYASPAELLADPANRFVEDFLGDDRGLKQLSLVSVSELAADPGAVVRPDDSLEHARRVAREDASGWVVIVGGDERLLGWLPVDELKGDGNVDELDWSQPRLTVRADDTLRSALNAMVAGRMGVAVRVDADGRYEGVITQANVAGQLT